jgi:hypothetical protein
MVPAYTARKLLYLRVVCNFANLEYNSNIKSKAGKPRIAKKVSYHEDDKPGLVTVMSNSAQGDISPRPRT